MRKQTIYGLSLALFAAVYWLGCDDSNSEEGSTDPIVGVMELPISLRNGGPAPTDAAHVEMSPSELRLEGHKLLDLANGKLPEGAQDANGIPALRDALQKGPARRALAIRTHVNVQYGTTAAVLQTALATNLHQVAFEVRKPGGAETGWLTLDNYRMRPASDEPFAFERGVQREWDEFVQGWDEAYTSCRRDHYVDCSPLPNKPAQGGQVQIVLFTRGSALKAEFTRVGGPEPAEAPAPQPQMLPGVPAPPEEEVEEPPVTDGAFTWRFAAATDELSPISGAFRPLCGARTCGVLNTSDRAVLTMRTVSFIGAAFPDGVPAPQVVFQIPAQ